MTEVVIDIEADGLWASIIHCLSYNKLEDDEQDTLIEYDDIIEFLEDPSMVLIAHNVESYDKPTLERILDIKIRCKIVDTLGLSWYLYPNRQLHGLASWGEDFGVPKPEVEDWEDQPIEVYVHRCEEDVKINTKLWLKIKRDLDSLYGKDAWWNAVEYITFKMHCAALKEKSRWKLDVDECNKLHVFFEEEMERLKAELQSVMPDVPKYVKKTKPKVCFKKNGDLSVHGEKWKELTEEKNYPFDYEGEIKVVSKYDPPNAGSPPQVKDWLFSKGWKPILFKYVRDKETGDVRKIPQIKNKDTGELCPNILELAKEIPELKILETLSIVTHRKSITNGFLADVDEDGFVAARIQGLTNTLRWKHKVVLNLPSLRKPYGKELRGLLIARDDEHELMGSDMASLEDRTKQHYMWDHDPEYVKDMMKPGFDPHCDIAIEAGLMTDKDVAAFKHMKDNDLKEVVGGKGDKYILKDLDLKRYGGKSTNYSATYGAGGETIARAAGVPTKVGKKLHKAYWKRNWSLKAIADGCVTKRGVGGKWLWNPVAEMWYSLRSDKDKFSTLNQGTGTFLFDMWLKEVNKVREQLTGDVHDEGIWEIKAGHREAAEKMLRDAKDRVNERYKLNRELDIDVQFGNSYADIH